MLTMMDLALLQANAFGSIMVSTSESVPLGAPVQLSGGEMFSLSQVYSVGMTPLLLNAALESVILAKAVLNKHKSIMVESRILFILIEPLLDRKCLA